MTEVQKKLPKFIETKARVWYRTLNKNGTGFLYRKDFDAMADDFISEFKLEEKVASELRSWMVDGWKAFIDCGTDSDNTKDIKAAAFSKDMIPHTFKVAEKILNGEFITEDMYIDAYTEVVSLFPDLFEFCFRKMVNVFFGVFDTDKDGMIDEADMIRGLRCFGFTKAEPVKAVYAELEKNSDGKVEFPTYIAAWIEFMKGEDENAPMGKYFTPEMCSTR